MEHDRNISDLHLYVLFYVDVNDENAIFVILSVILRYNVVDYVRKKTLAEMLF
jgi:hypothetical protein